MNGDEPRLQTVVVVIPARFESSRFPGKPLALIAGLPMIAHVLRRAQEASRVHEVWVATDDERIARVALGEGARAVMTSRSHASGTDRVAEAVAGLRADIVLNVQGDEPLIDPRSLDRLAGALLADPALQAATLGYPIRSTGEWLRPDVVKVVRSEAGRALYFSRAPIPHQREPSGGCAAWKHVGIYGFRRELLLRFASWSPGTLERLEGLEQLRLLEKGVPIQVVRAVGDSHGVDRPQDLWRIERLLRRRQGSRRPRDAARGADPELAAVGAQGRGRNTRRGA